MKFSKNISIDVNGLFPRDVIHFHQNDVDSAEFVITLTDNLQAVDLTDISVEYDASVNNLIVEEAAEGSVSGGKIIIPITENMTAIGGTLLVDVRLIDGGEIYHAYTVRAVVDSAVISDGASVDLSGITIKTRLANIDGILAQKANEADMTAALALKADAADVYTKTEADAGFASKPGFDTFVTETYADDMTNLEDAIDLKANSSDVASALALKANAADVTAALALKEDKSNKKTTLTGNESSNDFYPTTKAVADALEVVQEGVHTIIEEEVGDLKSAFNTFEIECYDRVESSGQERQNIDLSFTAGSYPKATHNAVSLETGITDIKYAVTSVVPGETIHVHCMNNWMARAYLFADSSGNGLSWFPENSSTPLLCDTDVVVPENATTMYIMGKLNTDVYAYRVIPVPVVITFNLDVDELMEKLDAFTGEELVANVSNDTLSVSNGVNTVVAGLHASNNGGFSFGSIYGKNASDDVCPVKINGSYVGGNHGFTAKIVVTNSNGHGKTIADIGSVYERSDIPGREYVIASVPNSTTIWLIRRDGSMEFINSGLSFTFTHVSGGVNTGTISFTSISSYQQLQPGINNIDLDIFADANRITSGETECKRLKIVESYNIISLAEIANYLISNVGQNDNSSYYDDAIAGIAKRTTVYEIIGDMSITVSDYLQSLGAYTLSSMGVVQSQMLGTKYLAPYTTYSGVQDITSNVTINKQVWSNVDVPPHKIYQLDTTSDIKGQLMLYPPFGLGETDQRVDALGANGIACTIDGSTKKFYPIFYGKNIEIATGTLIGGYAIRAPFEFDENGVFSFVYQIAGKTYAEIECLESGDYYASVGTEHSVIRNMMAKQNIVLNTETVIDGKVYFHCTGNGSITLEIA